MVSIIAASVRDATEFSSQNLKRSQCITRSELMYPYLQISSVNTSFRISLHCIAHSPASRASPVPAKILRTTTTTIIQTNILLLCIIINSSLKNSRKMRELIYSTDIQTIMDVKMEEL